MRTESSDRVVVSAIVGAGGIARQHIAAVQQLKGVQMVASCDLSPITAEAVADRYGLSAWYTDHRRMLDEVRPDVVHVTTPPESHHAIAMDAIRAGAHVIVEKPITTTAAHRTELLAAAAHAGRTLVEDFNYLYNAPVAELRRMAATGELGDVVHCEVGFALNILAEGSRFVDANLPHPALALPGGAIADFLPHLAYLAHAFVGAHRKAVPMYTKLNPHSPLPFDEFRGCIETDRGTAHLIFSSHAQPDAFWVRVMGTRARAEAQIFDPRVIVERAEGSPKPLLGFVNGRGVARASRRAAYASVWKKLAGGAGTYEGLWTLISEFYRSLAMGAEPPVTPRMIEEVGAMVTDLGPREVGA